MRIGRSLFLAFLWMMTAFLLLLFVGGWGGVASVVAQGGDTATPTPTLPFCPPTATPTSIIATIPPISTIIIPTPCATCTPTVTPVSGTATLTPTVTFTPTIVPTSTPTGNCGSGISIGSGGILSGVELGTVQITTEDRSCYQASASTIVCNVTHARTRLSGSTSRYRRFFPIHVSNPNTAIYTQIHAQGVYNIGEIGYCLSVNSDHNNCLLNASGVGGGSTAWYAQNIITWNNTTTGLDFWVSTQDSVTSSFNTANYSYTLVISLGSPCLNDYLPTSTPAPTITPTGTPAFCQMAGAVLPEINTDFLTFGEPVFVPGSCIQLLPNWLLEVPVLIQDAWSGVIPATIGFPGVEVCISYWSLNWSLFGFNVMLAFGLLGSLVGLVMIFREIRS